jgi:hypothetical protein
MIDATISRVRLRDLPVWAAPATPGLPPNGGPVRAVRAPELASSRPETGDLVASII